MIIVVDTWFSVAYSGSFRYNGIARNDMLKFLLCLAIPYQPSKFSKTIILQNENVEL